MRPSHKAKSSARYDHYEVKMSLMLNVTASLIFIRLGGDRDIEGAHQLSQKNTYLPNWVRVCVCVCVCH